MNKYVALITVCAVAGIFSFMFTRRQHAPGNIEIAGIEKAGTQTQQNPKALPNNKQGSPPKVIVLTNLPEHIQIIVQEYWHDPGWSTAKQLTTADKDILLQLYRQEPSLVKKHALTVALGLIGDEEVVETFKHTLSDEYAGRKLAAGSPDTNEENVMMATVSVMGFLANKSDSAYELVKKGIEPKFWKDYCKFIPATGVAFYGNLAGDSIKAIGRSGRSDAASILESLKPLPLVNDLDKSMMQRSFEGSVFDAAFADDIIKQRGMDFYKYLYFNLDACISTMQGWEKQGIGLEWNTWYQTKKME